MEPGSRAFQVRKHPSSDAERYLLLVREASRAVPDVMTMREPLPAPAPLCLPAARLPSPAPGAAAPASAAAQQPPAAPLDPPYEEPWIASALSTFATLRAHIAWWAARLEAGAPLPSAHAAAAAAHLQGASASAWRALCFGEAGSGSGSGSGSGAPPQDDNVWTAEEEPEEEGGEAGWGEEGGEGAEWGEEEEEEEEEEVSAAGAGADAAPQAPPPLPPLLTCVVALDQLSVARALARGVQAARARGAHAPLPLAEASWLYALLAALQVPFVGTTAATLRELYLLMRDQRRALGSSSSSLAAPSLLCIVAGRFFGQAWE